MFSYTIFTILPAALILFILTRMNYTFWPYAWPDEALFSSPAASLASRGIFATPVLEGLIPFMDQATLWNSPGYMVLLSFFYFITGESLHVARGVSFALTLLALFLFYLCLSKITQNRVLKIIFTILFVFDPVIHRAANTARMDMFTLVFVLATLLVLIKEFEGLPASMDSLKKSAKLYFAAGIFAGIACTGHPAGILAFVLIGIFSFPRLLLLKYSAAGAILALLPWITYILFNFNVFLVQFSAQLARKSKITTLWGGDTGGIFVVLFSQYGGGWPSMILISSLIFFVILAGLRMFYSHRMQWKHDIYMRIFASFIAFFLLVLSASEGWYAIYITPLLLLLVLYMVTSTPDFINRTLLRYTGIIFILLTTMLTAKHHILKNTKQAVQDFYTASLTSLKECKSVYVRTRPDPYFILREKNPGIRVYEFIPGKIEIAYEDNKRLAVVHKMIDFFYGKEGFGAVSQTEKFHQIDCFFIDIHDSWEPVLTAYLKENKDHFHVKRLEAQPPLEDAFLYKRKNHGKNESIR